MKADKLFYVLFYLVQILFSENESRYFWISLEFSVLAFGLNLTDWHVIFTIEKPLKVHLIFNFSLYFRSLISFFPHKILHFCIKVCDLKNWSWKMIFFRANFPNLLTRILKKNFSVFKLIQSMPSYKMDLFLINAVHKMWHLGKGYHCSFVQKHD